MTKPATPFRICTKQRHGVIDGKVDVYDANGELVAVQVDLATAQLVEAAPRMREALRLAEQFITNGIELGYVMHADAIPQCHTLPAIRAALSASVPERE